ncbi:MAG: hypothetical protein ACFB2Z_03155 [Maricaulaceae bacterium]
MVKALMRRIDQTSWLVLLGVLFAVFLGLVAFTRWAFSRSGPWIAASQDVSPLPEERLGFFASEPGASFALMETAGPAYLAWQSVDLVYVALNVAFMLLALLVFFKRFSTFRSLAAVLLNVPLIYGVAEIVENACLSALFRAGAPFDGPLVAVQQSATSIKLAAGFVGFTAAGLLLLLTLGWSALRLLTPGKHTSPRL